MGTELGRLVAPKGGQEAAPKPSVEEEIEVIEREKAQPQSVRIFHKRGKEVVVVEEENTTLEIKRLRSTLNTAMKKIEVSWGR